MSQPRKFVLAAYRFSLCLYSQEFQQRNGAEMFLCARQMSLDSVSLPRLAFALAEDLAQSLVTENLFMNTRSQNIPQLAVIVILTTFVAGTAYLISQQVLRTSANDPQIQLAEDAVRRLDTGDDLARVVSSDKVPMETSLAPFLIAYNGGGQAIASSATLDGSIPQYPRGALAHVPIHGESRLTWQPRPGVRIASVIARSAHGFVVSGRNLREVEDREALTLKLAAAGWLFANVLFCGLWLLLRIFGREKLNQVAL